MGSRLASPVPALLLTTGLLCAGLLAAAAPARADYAAGLSKQERDVYDYGPGGPGSSKGGSILDSTNPLELMNKLRKGMALDNATNPGDAIDAALKDLEAQSGPAQPAVSPPLKGP